METPNVTHQITEQHPEISEVIQNAAQKSRFDRPFSYSCAFRDSGSLYIELSDTGFADPVRGKEASGKSRGLVINLEVLKNDKGVASDIVARELDRLADESANQNQTDHVRTEKTKGKS